jgi:hypothetical protein
MRKLFIVGLMVVFVALPLMAVAQPVPGTYESAFRGGNVLNGRSSVSRQFPNSGNPKIFHGQSWDGATLGTQWEIKCGVQTTDTPPDVSQYNAGTGNGFITYHQTFQGGTVTLYTDANVGWGNGTATLGTTQATSQVFLVNFVPVSSSFTAFTSGNFENSNCTLQFAFGNGFGVGETPFLSKPANYPAFLAADCSPADAAHQFGVWADTNDIILTIFCPVPTQESTWGHVKALYR